MRWIGALVLALFRNKSLMLGKVLGVLVLFFDGVLNFLDRLLDRLAILLIFTLLLLEVRALLGQFLG